MALSVCIECTIGTLFQVQDRTTKGFLELCQEGIE
jgi:hypothetical protein